MQFRELNVKRSRNGVDDSLITDSLDLSMQ